MAEMLFIGNLRVELEYKRVKTLRMTLYPPAPGTLTEGPGEGRIHVSAPVHTPRQFIQNFVISKAAWIEKHRARFRGHLPAAPLRNDETHYVWGLPYRLELRQGRPRIVLDGGRMVMFVRPAEERRQQFLDKWYRSICKEAASRMVPVWADRVGVEVQRIYYRKMKSHWGSCNYIKKTIRLNTELAKKPPECLEYVILHELIHLLEPSHNQNFYRLMDRYLPLWKTIRKKMNRGEI
jgi:predicted metal-dependent hydrolase